MGEEENKKSNNWLLWALTGCCAAAIIISFYFFYYKKDYNFIVEVPCDVSRETCFQRDCSDPTNCPPNGLSDFKRYSLNANDFKMCANEDCTKACENGIIKCQAVTCTENLDVGESCSSNK
jgi:hypothetical protein